MTTFYNKLNALVTAMTDQCFLNCDASGIIGLEPLMIDTTKWSGVHNLPIDSICADGGELCFYNSLGEGIIPEEEDCEIAMNWIEENYADLFYED